MTSAVGSMSVRHQKNASGIFIVANKVCRQQHKKWKSVLGNCTQQQKKWKPNLNHLKNVFSLSEFPKIRGERKGWETFDEFKVTHSMRNELSKYKRVKKNGAPEKE
jgi:hypothetical protein